MIRKDYIGKKFKGSVFVMAARAKEAKAKYGIDNVIDATLGSVYDENDKIVVFDSVKKAYSNQNPEDYAPYAKGVAGSDEYREAVKKAVFGENYSQLLDKCTLSSIATPGGTGAISNTIKNYVAQGETMLLPSWMWDNYRMMVKENLSQFDTYEMFDNNGRVCLDNIKIKIQEYVGKQETLTIVINDPCQNPTGCKLTIGDWEELMNFFVKISEQIKLVLLLDIAYFEYDLDIEQEKGTKTKLFNKMTKNMIAIFCFSISKSLKSYGMRVGAQIAVATDKSLILEFEDACVHSGRATWSNISKGGMNIFCQIMNSPELLQSLKKERQQYAKLCQERAEIFLNEAQKTNLKILHYTSGFFLTVETGPKTEEIGEYLAQNNIFTLVLPKGGLRIAVCGVPKKKIHGLAEKIQDAINRFN